MVRLKTNKKAEPLEKVIQNEICEYLESKKHFFWRQNNTPIFQMDKGKARFRRMPKFSMLGIPDIIVLTDGGYAVFLEVKRPSGKLSEHQIKFKNKCEEKGCEYYRVTNLNQVKEIGL